MNNPFETLIQYVKSRVNFSAEEENLVVKYFEIKNYHKHETILNAGEICNHLYFVDHGLLRTFHINATEVSLSDLSFLKINFVLFY